MRPARPVPPPRPHRRHGQGFTLVEILVVITVLAILVALLLPAISSASRRVRDAAVQAELNRLGSAVVSFKTKFGGDPPSTILLYEKGESTPANTSSANWGWDIAARQAERTRSRALIRQLWPQFNFTAPRDLNGDGDSEDVIVLESGEALVFFLGGLPDRSGGPGKFAITPFSRNPQDPFSFAANANRDKSSYDFEPSRLVDLDSDKFPEFLDSYPGQTSPILYYSSYDGNGYRAAEFPGGSFAYGTLPAAPYIQNPGTVMTDGPASSPDEKYYQINVTLDGAYNKSTFQLISPGMDHDYGPGGPYLPPEGTSAIPNPLPPWNAASGSPTPDVGALSRRGERDNITNFGNGRLVP